MKQLLIVLFFGLSAFGAEESPTIASTAPKSYVTPIFSGLDLAYTAVEHKSFDWGQGATNGTRGHGLRLALEWIPFGDVIIGKPVVGVISGFSWITGARLSTGETSDLYTLPVAPYIGYRMDYFEDQLIVPYAKLGLNYTFLHQDSNSSSGGRKTDGGYLGMDYSLGAELCLNILDKRSIRMLDSKMGINSIYLIFEYSNSRQIRTQLANLSHEELVMGMRFEF